MNTPAPVSPRPSLAAIVLRDPRAARGFLAPVRTR